MTAKLPEELTKALAVLEIIEGNGHEAYFVGGCVRDFLLQRPIKDIDITSDATPEHLIEMFPNVIPVGLEHGTVIVRHNQVSYEITTFRHENPIASKRTLADDLQRRDFTINAIAMDQHRNIIDLYEGQLDLTTHLLRSVDNAYDRFTEDPLRILRALRFMSQLNFTIESATFDTMNQLIHSLNTVAIERVVAELELIFKGEYVQVAIDKMQQFDNQTTIPILNEIPLSLNKLPEKLTAFVSFAEVIALFHYLDQDISIAKWVKKWKLSNKIKNVAETLVFALDYYVRCGVDNWLAYTLPQDEYPSFIHLVSVYCQEDIKEALLETSRELKITSRTQLAIDGSDLLRLFDDLPRGRWISESLSNIEYAIVMGELSNTKKAIKEWIQCHPPEIN